MDTDTAQNLTKSLGVTAPSVAYLGVVCLLGLIGNSLVLFVYSRKFTRSPTRVFILTIAGFDLITNLLVIPGEMYTLLHWWNKGSDLFCKILMYLGAQSFIVAALLLVAVAFARFSKSIKGDKQQLRLRDVRQIGIVIVVASLVFSVPYAVVNGKRKKAGLPEGVSGYQCGADDAFPLVVSTAIAAFLILLFAVCVVPIVVLYSLVCCRTWRRRRVYVVGADSGKAGATPRDGKQVDEEPRGGSLPVVTSRSRSYIKKKAEAEKVSASGHAHDQVSAGGVQAEDNVIEFVEENEPEVGDARLCEARLIRSPTGDKVTVNLSMVRELTVKLKAVQKQAEKRLAQGGEQAEDVADCPSENNNEIPVKSDKLGQKTSRDTDDASKTEEKEVSKNNLEDKPKEETDEHEARPEINQGDNAELTDDHSPPHKLTTEETAENVLKQAANSEQKQEQLAEEERHISGTDAGESSEIKPETDGSVLKGERKNAEPQKEADDMQESSLYIPSDFAKAMQWVEITYCQRTDPRPSDGDDEVSGVDPASLMKKGSFMSSRKVSRDNSFLRKHRKLRDALTDTLTRARKSKKDRDERNGSCPDVSDKQNDRISEDVNDTDSFNLNDTSTDSEVTPRHRKEAAQVDNCDISSCVRTGIPDDRAREREQDSRDSKRGLGATTWMLLIVSLIYVISSLPYLALNFIRSQSPDAFISVDESGEVLYNVFIRANFLNSAVKPAVYVICNVKFRHQCWKLLKHC